MAGEHKASDGDDRAMASWPGLAEARVVAAERGASSVGTEHVLLSLLWGPEDDASRALRGAGLDYHAIAVALEAVVGPGRSRPISREPVVPRISSRVEQLLHDARHRARGTAADGELSDHHVLAALLDSNEQCVANLVMNYVGVRRRALDGLQNGVATPATTDAA